jgi:hypothetical protein
MSTCFAMHMQSSGGKTGHNPLKKPNSLWSFTVVVVLLLLGAVFIKSSQNTVTIKPILHSIKYT